MDETTYHRIHPAPGVIGEDSQIVDCHGCDDCHAGIPAPGLAPCLDCEGSGCESRDVGGRWERHIVFYDTCGVCPGGLVERPCSSCGAEDVPLWWPEGDPPDEVLCEGCLPKGGA